MKKHIATALHVDASMNVIKGSLAAFFFPPARRVGKENAYVAK